MCTFHDPRRLRRPGKILVLFAFSLVVLLGMVGLVLDSGLAQAGHRNAQNAADAAALAAAMKLNTGDTIDIAKANAVVAATTFVRDHNGLADATVTVRFGDEDGFTGAPAHRTERHVEVIVSSAIPTTFIQILMPDTTTTTVTARACAGPESLPVHEGVIILDPNRTPGLRLQTSPGNPGQLNVHGAIIINSKGTGVDVDGVPVDWGLSGGQPAAAVGTNAVARARLFDIVGGVEPNNTTTYQNIDPPPANPNPLLCRQEVRGDPLRLLPIPKPGNGTLPMSFNFTRRPGITVNGGQTRTLDPGVYEDIQVNSGGTLILNPGVYIFSPTGPGHGLRVNGDCTIGGPGTIPALATPTSVLLYVTGSNYLDAANGHGYWDELDGALDGPLPAFPATSPAPSVGATNLGLDPYTGVGKGKGSGKVDYAAIDINANSADIKLTGLTWPPGGSPTSSLLPNIVIFQRRRNESTVKFASNAGTGVVFDGAIYAKWGEFRAGGRAVSQKPFVVRSLEVTGGASLTIQALSGLNQSRRVYLVE